MCRLLGIVSSETTTFRFSLHDAPRSLATLSRQHPHGWGLAVFGKQRGSWRVHKQAACAGEDSRFVKLAARARGELLVAHIRRATVGRTRTENTHPFTRDRWVFAHNGTIQDTSFLAKNTSRARASELEGETDSERLFAYLLTAIDRTWVENAATEKAATSLDEAIGSAVARLRRRASLGSASFLLSNGLSLWAHRRERSLFQLERGKGDRVIPVRTSSETAARVETPWSPRRRAILLASERLSDEPWREIEEGSLLRVDHGPEPRWSTIDA